MRRNKKYECLNSIDNDDKKGKFVENWSYLIKELRRVASGEVDGLMMGAINKLFDKIKVKKYKDAYSEKLRASIDKYLSPILSDKGNSSISDLQNIFSAKNRDKYRNPPAHTRYVGDSIRM